MKAAFSKNKKAATIFRDKIRETVNTKLKGETFAVNKREGLTFEEAIIISVREYYQGRDPVELMNAQEGKKHIKKRKINNQKNM